MSYMMPSLNVSIERPNLKSNLDFSEEVVHAEYDGCFVYCGNDRIRANVYTAAAVSELKTNDLPDLKYGEFYSSALWYVKSCNNDDADKQRLRRNLDAFLALKGDTRNVLQLFRR